jgi:hypothetical protein
MKIKMNTSIGSAEFNYAARQIVEVDDDLGAKWIGSGIASPVDEPMPVERAVVDEAESFETPESPKPRKK